MGYCNSKGELVLPAIYQKALAFRGKIAPVVWHDLQWWFINENGEPMFNTRRYMDQWPPEPAKGLYKITYQDPDFGLIEEFYNKYGWPVKVKLPEKVQADTLVYAVFSAAQALQKAEQLFKIKPVPDSLEGLGFLRTLYKPFGIHIPAFITELIQKGREVKQRELKVGDLVFVAGQNPNSIPFEFVGMVSSFQSKNFEFMHYHPETGMEKARSNMKPFAGRKLTFRRLFN